MDSPTGFEDDERLFFASYEAEQGPGGSSLPLLAHHALEAVEASEEEPPTHEELAHFTRFRRPVAYAVGTLALFSVVALGQLSPPPRPQRKLVAHYHAAVAAPTQLEAVTITPNNEELPEADSDALPESTTARDFFFAPSGMCLKSVSPLGRWTRGDGAAGGPALDLWQVRGQADSSWSLPLSMTWSSPFVRP